MHERLELAEQDKRNAVELAKNKVSSEMQKATAAKDAEIQELKAKLDANEVAQKLAVAEALSIVEKERDALANELEQAKRDKQAASELADEALQGTAGSRRKERRRDPGLKGQARRQRGCAEARNHRRS